MGLIEMDLSRKTQDFYQQKTMTLKQNGRSRTGTNKFHYHVSLGKPVDPLID